MSQPARRSAPEAGAFGAKTARACDSCLRRRARWYCAADDAFLCQPCDASVHSANPLARRHERVRLKSSSSFKPQEALHDGDDAEPSWHHGFKRKARTPRGGSAKKGDVHGAFGRADTVVPDLDLASLEEFPDVVEEEQLLYRVPIMDPLLAELCSPPTPREDANDELQHRPEMQRVQVYLPGELPIAPDMDIPEFDMDVETLLGRELDEDAFSIEDLGLAEAHECNLFPAVKMEEEADDKKAVGLPPPPAAHRLVKVDADFDFQHCCSHGDGQQPWDDGERRRSRRRIMLDLDYEGVVRAWDEQASPWVDGARPQLDLDGWSPESLWEEAAPRGVGGAYAAGDGGREARVSRYREKRRTRLFSKKIRYEVRKLNAEKRPRMKGRFVKRSSLLSGNASHSQPQCVF